MALFALTGVPFVGQCASLLITRVPAAARRVADGAASTLTVGLPLALVAALWFVATNHYYRWSGETREFGTGVYEVFFPIRASAFIAEHKLPPPIYNDDTTGGYLAYARPVPGGPYIDGRLEVYDVDLYTRYQDALNNPVRWQAEADQRGIQTEAPDRGAPAQPRLIVGVARFQGDGACEICPCARHNGQLTRRLDG